MGALLVVAHQPGVQIALHVLEGGVDLLSKRHPVEFIEHRFMKALADPVGLRAFGFGAGVVDVFHREVELIFVMLGIAAIFRAPIGQHPQEGDVVFRKEGHHPVVQ